MNECKTTGTQSWKKRIRRPFLQYNVHDNMISTTTAILILIMRYCLCLLRFAMLNSLVKVKEPDDSDFESTLLSIASIRKACFYTPPKLFGAENLE